MKTRLPVAGRCLLLAVALTIAWLAGEARMSAAAGATGYAYVSPMPGSRLVSRWNNIAIRDGDPIDPATIDAASLAVVGSTSGRHAGRLQLSDDSRTLIFEPAQPFALGETVVVRWEAAPHAIGGRGLAPLEFGFTVAPRDPPRSLPPRLVAEDAAPLVASAAGGPVTAPRLAARAVPPGSAMPTGYPPMTLLTCDHPDSGYVFIAPRVLESTAPLLIVDNNLMPVFYRHGSGNLLDFKLQPNGWLTYFDGDQRKEYALDNAYAVVDSFEPGNGYVMDFHDFQILPNGHCLLLAVDEQPVGMDTVVAGGDPDAIVMGFVVQELDAAKQVVFQWRTFDHFQITDAFHVDLTASWIDYAHTNSVALDPDGNLIISSRHLNEITKIDRWTGDVIWRLGLHAVHNQFTFVNDTRGFSYQHDARRLPNGDLTLFDNDNDLAPASRAVEYALDEQAKTATLVWSAAPTAGVGTSNGSVQRRDNGSTMICWGAGGIRPKVSDLHADGTAAFVLDFSPVTTCSYRAFRWPWRGTRFATDATRLSFGDLHPGDQAVLPLTITNGSATSSLTITSFVLLDSTAFQVVERAPITIPPAGSATVHVRFQPDSPGDFSTTLYVRSDTADEIIAQDVALEGVGVPGHLAASVLFPNGAERFVVGGAMTTDWRADSGVGTTTVDVYMSRSGSAGPFELVASDMPNSGSYTWPVFAPATDQAYVKIVTHDQDWNEGEDESDAAFQIVASSTAFVDTPVAEFALTRVAPNPTSGGAGIEFTVARQAPIRLSVVDVQGRTVVVLAEGVRSAGRYRATWDGLAGGGLAPDGIYLVRYEAPGMNRVRRIVVLR